MLNLHLFPYGRVITLICIVKISKSTNFHLDSACLKVLRRRNMNVIVSREHRNDGQRRVFFVKLGPRASFVLWYNIFGKKAPRKTTKIYSTGLVLVVLVCLICWISGDRRGYYIYKFQGKRFFARLTRSTDHSISLLTFLSLKPCQ